MTDDSLPGEVELLKASLDLTQVVDGADRPTVVVDGDLQVIKASAAFHLGPAAPGTPVPILARPFEDAAAIVREISEAVRTGTRGQRQVRAGDGRWYLMRVFSLGGGSASTGAIVTFTDIDGTKAMDARFQLAMSTARLVWWDWDFATGVIAVYGEANCILGYTPDTLPRTQSAWLAHTHPDDVAAVNAAIQACMEGRASEWSLTHRFRAADGSWRWVHNCGRPAELDYRGAPTRMLGVTRDVHEAHEAARVVKRDAAILAQLQDAVMTSDHEYRILSVNDAYERIFGWRKTEAEGQHALFRIPEPGRSDAQRILDRVLCGESISLEWEDYRRDGTRVWIHWRAQPLLDEKGRLIGTINIGSNITERKEAAERQRQLQQQLFHAQKMDTLGTLAGGIAHDFNNILAAIFGYSELATMRTNESEEVRHFHEEITKAGVRGRELVKRILAFSRFEEPALRPVRLSDVIADAGKFMRATLPSTVEVVMDVPRDLPYVQADPHQLCQVLLNLATNAAHAMDHRGKFSLRVRRMDISAPRASATGPLEAGHYLVIEAEDTGHGIPAAVLPRIFDPFFTTKKEGEGTGLGLSVVRAIVDGHGGRIDVRSEPDRGTQFVIYLPRAAAPVAAPSETVTEAPVPRGDGQTIAIIDDDEQIAAVTVAVLQRLGYQAMAFESALKFWALFSAAPHGIDAVITDQTMPAMTGLELVRRLREEGHEIPVLLVTGFSAQVRGETLSQYSNVSLLRKPYERRELGNAVHALLNAEFST